MKTVFVINPKAGLGVRFQKTLETIEKIGCETYVTRGRGDATQFVKNYTRENGEARFIACGGDGTYNEVLNGVIEAGCGEAGFMPIGSGNDFCRNFGDKAAFLNPENQIKGEAVPCDAIRYTLTLDGETKIGICANMINIGFDCAVADTTDVVKNKTVFSGSLAYLVSIFINIIKKSTVKLYIETDEEKRYEGELLLSSLANGSYCGGGLKTNPLAEVSDGLININIVNNVTRRKIFAVLPEYINGSYPGKEKFKSIVSSEKCKTVKVVPLEGKMRISVDGELMDAESLELEILHNAYNFVDAGHLKVDTENVLLK